MHPACRPLLPCTCICLRRVDLSQCRAFFGLELLLLKYSSDDHLPY
eukprot:COSAG05_NODE_6013_length_1041_cov_1.177282_1_plen_45_part_10